MHKEVAAVIVTFNRLEKLKETLEKSLAQNFLAVVVVNNCSTDGTRDWLDKQSDPRLHVIHSAENLGGAGGFNRGFDYATNELTDAHWLVCFDDDAYPQANLIDSFNALDIPKDIGALAAAVYLPDGRISEMNRPGVNPFWHLREFIKTAFRGRAGFHIDDSAYDRNDTREIDSSSFVGFFLRLSLIREKRIGLPRTELFIYADDIIYVLEMRKAGIKHWFVPALRFTHDCQTLVNQKDVYHPLWRVYFTFRNRQEMYRVAAGKFFPLVALLKIPKLFLAVRHYEPEERKTFLKTTYVAVNDGLKKDYSKSFREVLALTKLPD